MLCTEPPSCSEEEVGVGVEEKGEDGREGEGGPADGEGEVEGEAGAAGAVKMQAGETQNKRLEDG